MAVKIRKPILVGGLGLTALLWGWEIFNSRLSDLGEFSFFGIFALGSGLWLWKTRSQKLQPLRLIAPLTQAQVEEAIADSRAKLALVAQEVPQSNFANLAALQATLDNLAISFDRKDLTVAITGSARTGKSTLKALLEPLAIAENIQWQEAAPLTTVSNLTGSPAFEPSLITADLVLYLLTGDLTDSAWQQLQSLYQAHHLVLILLNKQDQYLSEERSEILHNIRQQVQSLFPKEAVISLAAAPNPIIVRKHLNDGSIQVSKQAQAVEIGDLVARIAPILQGDRANLVLGSLWRQAQQINHQAQSELNLARRDRALTIIERYQWIAAAAAFANPVPTLDLLATAAINAQLLVDLGAIYQQPFSLSQAQAASGTLGKLMAQLGLVELSSQAIGTLLKGHVATYLVGGAIQGISVAYLTRIAGLSWVEYFQDQSLTLNRGVQDQGFNLDTLSQKLQWVFAHNQRSAVLSGFVDQAIQRLAPGTTKTAIAND
jgi:uncharacterized protein (DUF697 family)